MCLRLRRSNPKNQSRSPSTQAHLSKKTTIATKTTEVIESMAFSEIKAIAETISEAIEPEEPEASPVVLRAGDSKDQESQR
jgi:hypothetical protein